MRFGAAAPACFGSSDALGLLRNRFEVGAAVQPFALEIAKIAGWYDGRRINVSGEASADDMVRFHESQHASIFLNTLDGQLLQICIKSRDWISSLDHRICADQTISAHIDRAREAHEASATFVGVEMLRSQEERERAYASLPEPYRHHYAQFERVVGLLAQSSFMRCACAQALTHLLFSSRAFDEFVTSDFDHSALLHDPPDARFVRFLDWWETEGSELTMHFISTELQAHDTFALFWDQSLGRTQPFAGLDDDDVLMRSADLARSVDAWSIASLYLFWIEASPLRSISSGSEEWESLAKQAKNYFERHERGFHLVHRQDMSSQETRPSAEDLDILQINASVVMHKEPFRCKAQSSSPVTIDRENFASLLACPDRSISLVFHQGGFLSGPAIVDVGRKLSEAAGDAQPDTRQIDKLCLIDPLEAIHGVLNHIASIYLGRQQATITSIVVRHEDPADGSDYQTLKSYLHTNPALPIFRDHAFDASELVPITLLAEVVVEYVTSDIFEFTADCCQHTSFGVQAVQMTGQPDVLALWRQQEDILPQTLMKIMPLKFGLPLALHWKKEAVAGRRNFQDHGMPAVIESAIRMVMNHWTVV